MMRYRLSHLWQKMTQRGIEHGVHLWQEVLAVQAECLLHPAGVQLQMPRRGAHLWQKVWLSC